MKQKINNKKEVKMWYYGTRAEEFYYEYPSNVPEYKRTECLTDAQVKKVGMKKAKEILLAPSFWIGDIFDKKASK